MKRFWREAVAMPAASGWEIRLDGRALRLPGGGTLSLPGAALAHAVASEWRMADGGVVPDRLPMTRLAGTLQQVGPATRAGLQAALLAYGAGDMLCHHHPDQPLAGLQREHWQPWLDWLRATHGIGLAATAVLDGALTDQAALAGLRALLGAQDDVALAVLGAVVPALGSLVLGLALVGGAIDPDAAFRLSVLEETVQAERWGRDAEAVARSAALRTDIVAAARFLALCRDPDGGSTSA